MSEQDNKQNVSSTGKKRNKTPKEAKPKEKWRPLFYLIGHKKPVTVAFVLWLNVAALLGFLFMVFKGFIPSKWFWIVVAVLAGLILILLLITRFYKTSMVINGLLAVVLAVASVYSGQIVPKLQAYITEQQTDRVYVITRNDGAISTGSSFYFLRFGEIQGRDYYTNWGLTILQNAGKTSNLITQQYDNAVSAYNALLNNEVDILSVSSADLSEIQDDAKYADTQLNYAILYEDKTITKLDLSPVDLSSQPFLLYIAGIDISGIKDITGNGRSDVNILVAFNPNTGKASMQFVPRDTWVNVPCDCCSNKKTKLNRAMDYGGTSCGLKTVETYFDIDINYYIKVDFYTVIHVVDALGGITLDNPTAFTFKTTNWLHEERTYKFPKGEITLDGDEALAYARDRKDFAQGTAGDLARGQRQMLVIQACLTKFTQNMSLDLFTKVLDAAKGDIATNFSESDMVGLLNIYAKIKDKLEIKTYTMKGSTTDVYTDPIYHADAYYFLPKDGEKEKVKARIEAVLNGQELLAD